jgi:glycosyltransferase involved in cell wall biosynthesis
MLSICIPVYNYNVEKLIGDLHRQASALGVAFEIICIDDCSDTHFKNQNNSITDLSNVKYIELIENMGRSKIRNLFLDYVSYTNLLFLDCDAQIVSDVFVSRYVDSIEPNIPVIFGGLKYSLKKPQKEFLLRWKYGHAKEVVSFENRLKDPYKSFKTINFLIKKGVLGSIKFDEQIVGYGHEDTWFGFQLKKAGFQIKQINNPVLHTQLETNEQFLNKTEQSIENLLRIVEKANDTEFEEDITLLQTYRKVKNIKSVFILALLFWISKPLVRRLLVSGFANQKLFAFYKLGILISKYHK